jgi:hypothetical protein
MNRLFKFASIPTGLMLISLTGCATVQPPAPPDILPEQQALMDSVQKIEQVSASLRTADTPYKGFPLPDASPSPSSPSSSSPDYKNNAMNHVINAKWSGKASTLLAGVAQRVGWTFENRYTGSQPDVTISMKNVKIVDVLREVAKQLPMDAVVSVHTGRIILSN